MSNSKQHQEKYPPTESWDDALTIRACAVDKQPEPITKQHREKHIKFSFKKEFDK
jgi:hypothetical protein